MAQARLVGINHVALEVGDLDAALEFYGRWLDFELRGRVRGMAFLDAGDQFLALSEGRRQGPDDDRHFGLVVDDRDAVRDALDAGRHPARARPRAAGARPVGQRRRDRRLPGDPVLQGAGVLAGMGLAGLEKTEAAQQELAEKGLSRPTAGSPPP